jgi:hypothetical protein
MKVKYLAENCPGTCYDLTDGKIYEVEGEAELEDDVPHYFIYDDEPESELKDLYPYPKSYFEVVEQ